MATGGLYGSSGTGALIAQPGSESSGLYGNSTSFGGTYFEWFVFQTSETQPATPTGGSWNFTTNANTPPVGWSSTPPSNPLNTVWVSIAIVNSKNTAPLVWSVPGKFAFSSGLPILFGNGAPNPGDGQSDQLYIQLDTAPQTIWAKETGTWTRLTGSTLYADLTSNQTIAGTKTFSSQIQGSISGTASNVTGTVAITNGGTGSTTAASARVALGALNNITSTDGSVAITSPSADVRNLSVISAASTSIVVAQVRNTTGATLTKGTVVYITGATGQISTVSKALANADATSAQTLGMITSDLPNNTNGNVTIIGLISNIDTSSYADGAQLYLSPTVAGAVTTTKPYAPNHLVYVGIVEYSHPVNGKIFVKVQNGYELDELHDVAAQSPTNGQTIVYNSSTNLWEKNTVSLAIGVNGTLPILNGGTGQTTANAAFNALAPSQTGNSGRYLTTDGTNTSWAVNPLGTVTSVSGTGTVNGLTLTGTVTTSGSLTLGGTLNLSSPPTIGNTTPNTGAFTTLTTSSTVTLNGGTANGVAYLNGSKVLTTGSALTFDGTNLLNSGALRLTGGASSNIRFEASGSEYARIMGNGSNSLDFAVGGTTPNMSLTSTGLGIGVSSPASRLDVNGKITLRNGSDTRLGYIKNEFGALFIGSETSGTTDIVFQTNGPTERMRLDSSGNLGIGTSSPSVKLQVYNNINGTPFAWGNAARTGYLYQDANGVGITNASGTGFDEGVYLDTANSKVVLYTNSTDRVTLDSSGNLGLGVTPSAWGGSGFRAIDVGSKSSFAAGGAGQPIVTDNAFYNGSNFIYKQTLAASFYQQNTGTHAWFTAPSGTAGNAISFTQAMTLNASGFLGIGTTNPPYGLTVSDAGGVGFEVGPGAQYGTGKLLLQAYNRAGGAYAQMDFAANTFAWLVSGTERARIDASGNLLIGTTSALGKVGIVPATSQFGAVVNAPSSSGTYYFHAFQAAGTGIGSITSTNGTATLYNTTSDQRLKENIADAASASDLIDALQVRQFDWKTNGTHQRYGFVAQELTNVAPEAVYQPTDADEMMAVDYSKLVPMLVKEIQSLRARVAALEAA